MNKSRKSRIFVALVLIAITVPIVALAASHWPLPHLWDTSGPMRTIYSYVDYPTHNRIHQQQEECEWSGCSETRWVTDQVTSEAHTKVTVDGGHTGYNHRYVEKCSKCNCIFDTYLVTCTTCP